MHNLSYTPLHYHFSGLFSKFRNYIALLGSVVSRFLLAQEAGIFPGSFGFLGLYEKTVRILAACQEWTYRNDFFTCPAQNEATLPSRLAVGSHG